MYLPTLGAYSAHEQAATKEKIPFANTFAAALVRQSRVDLLYSP